MTANLRLHTGAALIRVASTHASTCRLEDNGHGAWLVSGLQPRANTALCTTGPPAPACPDGDAPHLPSRSKLSSESTEALAEAVRLAEADFDYAQSMLSSVKAQSAREQKGKHRPPDARAAQQQRWAETVEQWASETDAAWRRRSEARGRLRPADVALRGEQARYAQLHTRGYAAFARGEHGVRIPSAETVAGEVGSWTAIFNRGVDKQSKKPGRGEGGRWQGRKTASPGVDAPSITAVESDVREWLGPDGLNWLATASGGAGCNQKTVEAHALLRGVQADVAANGQYSGKPARDGVQFKVRSLANLAAASATCQPAAAARSTSSGRHGENLHDGGGGIPADYYAVYSTVAVAERLPVSVR